MTNKFSQDYMKTIRGIELCLENKLQLPALTLIYSSIDSLSWIAYEDKKVSKRFTKFIDNYMYKAKQLKPSSLDLYAARCSILHTLTPESDLSNNGKALQIAYAWGNASVNDLEVSINLSEFSGMTCLHINDLFESFKLGLLLFLELNSTNEKCLSRMSKHFTTLSKDTIQTYNKIME